MYQLNPLMYHEANISRLLTVAGTYKIPVVRGRYSVKVCGAGGAGGANGLSDGYAGGEGGPGGTAMPETYTVDITSAGMLTVYVGAGGKTYANGGNGGAGGDRTTTSHGNWGQVGGPGGGGGYPSYVKTNGLADTEFLSALGGGGGGGGGGGAGRDRYSGGGGGGGGGGYYRFADGVITSVPGQKGGKGAKYWDTGGAGVNGNTQDFPSIASGHGGRGGAGSGSGPGGAAAYGGGASGAGGGGGDGNSSNAYGGRGAGGAGGSETAGGGRQGGGGGTGATEASNLIDTPIAGTDYQGNVVTSGWGVGGTTNTNGSDGWVYIVRTGDIPQQA